MGGEKFDSPQPESFLFGENSDLNFLGNQPVPFPYPPPQANEPTKTLRSLVNIRRDSLHFVLAPSPTGDGAGSKTTTPSLSKGTSEEGEEGNNNELFLSLYALIYNFVSLPYRSLDAGYSDCSLSFQCQKRRFL